MNSYVYEHIRQDTGMVFYVGKGKGNRAYHFLNRNKYWTNIYNKTAINVSFLVKNIDEELAFLVEMERIDQLRRCGFELANMTSGGEGMANPSPETLAKLSKSRKGRITSEEAKQKLSAAHKGKKLTEEHKAKLSAAKMGKPSPWKGRSPSAEARAKMSAAKLGKPSNRIKGKENE